MGDERDRKTRNTYNSWIFDKNTSKYDYKTVNTHVFTSH